MGRFFNMIMSQKILQNNILQTNECIKRTHSNSKVERINLLIEISPLYVIQEKHHHLPKLYGEMLLSPL